MYIVFCLPWYACTTERIFVNKAFEIWVKRDKPLGNDGSSHNSSNCSSKIFKFHYALTFLKNIFDVLFIYGGVENLILFKA